MPDGHGPHQPYQAANFTSNDGRKQQQQLQQVQLQHSKANRNEERVSERKVEIILVRGKQAPQVRAHNTTSYDARSSSRDKASSLSSSGALKPVLVNQSNQQPKSNNNALNYNNLNRASTGRPIAVPSKPAVLTHLSSSSSSSSNVDNFTRQPASAPAVQQKTTKLVSFDQHILTSSSINSAASFASPSIQRQQQARLPSHQQSDLVKMLVTTTTTNSAANKNLIGQPLPPPSNHSDDYTSGGRATANGKPVTMTMPKSGARLKPTGSLTSATSSSTITTTTTTTTTSDNSNHLYLNKQQATGNYNLNNLSPIKPSFVNSKESNNSSSNFNNQSQFSHSTPNHRSNRAHREVGSSRSQSPFYGTSSRLMPMMNRASNEHHGGGGGGDDESAASRSNEKQKIVKELAVNILELNGYRTRTEQLDNELKNYNQLKSRHASSASAAKQQDYASVSEKTESIQSELNKLKSEMLKKIEDIHELESELVTIESHNISGGGGGGSKPKRSAGAASSSSPNRSLNARPGSEQISAHRNEEVMNEIRSMLKEMVNNNANYSASQGAGEQLARSLSANEHMATMRRLREEYQHQQQRAGGGVGVNRSASTSTNRTGSTSPVRHQIRASLPTGGRAASTVSASMSIRADETPDLSISIQAHPGPGGGGGGGSLSSTTIHKLDFFRNQLEKEVSFIHMRAKEVEFKMKNSRSADDQAHHYQAAQHELDNLKHLIKCTNEKLERDKVYLLREIRIEDRLCSANEFVFNNIKYDLENLLFNKQTELQNILKHLLNILPTPVPITAQSMTDYSNPPSHRHRHQKSSSPASVRASGPTASYVTSNVPFTASNPGRAPRENNERPVEERNEARRSDSSFLTEEEEAIKLISDRIRTLKAKQSSKEKLPKFSKRYNSRGGQAASLSSSSAASSDDSDAKELAYLNEQIRLLKSKVIEKRDRINEKHTRRRSSHQSPNAAAASRRQPTSSSQCSGPIYLPIHHQKSENNYEIKSIDLESKISPVKTSSTFDDEKRVFYVNKAASGEYQSSPERKYTSSIEIPAERLEYMKNNSTPKNCFYPPVEETPSETGPAASKPRRRCRSYSSSSASSVSRHGKRSDKTTKSRRGGGEETNLVGSNLLSVSLKSLKYPQPSKETMTDLQDQLEQELAASQKEIEDLRKQLREQGEATAEKSRPSKSSSVASKQKPTPSELYEAQQAKIASLKEKLKRLNGLNSDELTSSDDNAEDRRKVNVRTQKAANQASRSLSPKREALGQEAATKHRARSVANEPSQVAELGPAEVQQQQQESMFVTSLICNIPEHHELEDMLHKRSLEIQELKKRAVNELFLEKNAELKALDLAIDERRKNLVKLELGVHGCDSTYLSGRNDETTIRDEIECVESTLAKRNRELAQVEYELRTAKRELHFALQTRKNIEHELEGMSSHRKSLSKELKLLDKRADDVTIELIIAQQELDCMQERKSKLEKDIGDLKSELVNYLKGIKPSAATRELRGAGEDEAKTTNELDKSVRAQRDHLRALNDEIRTRKSEIDDLRERSVGYLRQFKAEIGDNERELVKMKNEKIGLVNEMSQLGREIEELREAKNKYAVESKYETDKIEANRKNLLRQHDNEMKKLNDLMASVEERRQELDKYDAEFDKRKQALDELKSRERDLIKSIENLNVEIHKNRSRLDEMKKSVESEKLNKKDLKERIETLNSELVNLNEQFEQRKHEYVGLDEQYAHKQMLIDQENEAKMECEYERANMIGELEQLNEKVRERQSELDKLEQALKLTEMKLQQGEDASNALSESIVKCQYELETREQRLKECKLVLNDSNNKIKLKQQYLEELGGRIKKKEEEVDYLDTCLQDLKGECLNEKKELELLQNEYKKLRRNYEQLKTGNKTSSAKELNEPLHAFNGDLSLIENVNELQTKLNERDRYIEHLERLINERNSELVHLNEAFLSNRDQTEQFKSRLKELEELTKLEHESLFDTDVKSFLKNLENSQVNSPTGGGGGQPTTHVSDLIRGASPHDSQKPSPAGAASPGRLKINCSIKHSYEKTAPARTTTTSSLLITPSIKKSTSSQVVIENALNNTYISDYQKSKQNTDNSELIANKSFSTTCKCEVANEDTDSSNNKYYKDKILNKLNEKMVSLEKSKSQTRNLIDNLKTTLNQIELMTANNIFKITNMTSSPHH